METREILACRYLDGNKIWQIESGALRNQRKLIWLWANQYTDKKLIRSFHTLLGNLPQFIIFRNLSKNKLSDIRRGLFVGLESLEWLMLEDNQIETADLTDFENQTSLELMWDCKTRNWKTSVIWKSQFFTCFSLFCNSLESYSLQYLITCSNQVNCSKF